MQGMQGEVNKEKSDIEKLKELFPENYTALLIAPPGSGEKEYCYDLVKYYLEKGEKVVYITTEQSPEEIKEKLSQVGVNIDEYEAKSFVFIDAYSYSTGKRYDKGFTIDNPANLNLITINLTNAAQIIGKPLRIIFDSLSTLFLHADENEIRKFFGVLTSRVKSEFGFLLCTLHGEMHSRQSVIALRAMVDAVIEIEVEEKPELKRKIRIFSARGLKLSNKWHVFDVSDYAFKVLGEYVAKEKAEEVKEASAATVAYEAEKPKTERILIIAFAAILILGISFFAINKVFLPKSGAEKTGKESTSAGEKIEKMIYEINKGENAYIKVKNIVDTKTGEKGWLYIENPYYIIKLNLDKPYYLLYDKINKKDILIFNDKIEQKHEMLTGSTIGYADLDGENLVSFSSVAIDDDTGIEYSVVSANKEQGYIAILTKGWDFKPAQVAKAGYDVEAQELFFVFADKPYFIDAVKLYNLQNLGYASKIKFRNPTEIVKDWVLLGDYDHAVIKGGDKEHLNKQLWEPFYEVQSIRAVRKPWHAGSACFSKMFPEHVLIGSKIDGGIIFSLPKGKFRFDDSKGMKGTQIAGEFILIGEQPEKFTAFAVDAVNRNTFFYDARDYLEVPGYKESLAEICSRYGLTCTNVIDARDWDIKMFAYTITLVSDWYDAGSNNAKQEIWELADNALKDFYKYESIIYNELEKSKPLIASFTGR